MAGLFAYPAILEIAGRQTIEKFEYQQLVEHGEELARLKARPTSGAPDAQLPPVRGPQSPPRPVEPIPTPAVASGPNGSATSARLRVASVVAGNGNEYSGYEGAKLVDDNVLSFIVHGRDSVGSAEWEKTAASSRRDHHRQGSPG